jgi:mono/diheme cytochrome c family protein
MNKQKRALELSAILIFIAILCVLVWNYNPHSGSDQPIVKNTDTVTASPPKSSTPSPDAEKWAEGKSLFKSNCASCHNPKVAQTGPALMGVTKRWEDAGTYQGKTGKQWLYTWIKNWNTAVSSGYPYAVNIQHYTESSMSTFPSLKDEEIDQILLYVETPSATAKAEMP